MGIDPSNLTDRQRELMDPAEHKALGLEAPNKTRIRRLRTLERDEQRILSGWLKLREDDGVLVYDWSRTDRRTTNRKGIPDLRIYALGKVLFGEMKLAGGTFSDNQLEMIAKLRRSGTEVQIWDSAATAIERIRDWLSVS